MSIGGKPQCGQGQTRPTAVTVERKRAGRDGGSKVTSGLGRLSLGALGSAALGRAAGAGAGGDGGSISSLRSHFLFLAGSGGGGTAGGGVQQLVVLLAAQWPPWEWPRAQRPLLVGLAEGVGAELAEGLRVLAAHVAVVPGAVPAACRGRQQQTRGCGSETHLCVHGGISKHVQPMQFHRAQPGGIDAKYFFHLFFKFYSFASLSRSLSRNFWQNKTNISKILKKYNCNLEMISFHSVKQICLFVYIGFLLGIFIFCSLITCNFLGLLYRPIIKCHFHEK